MILKITKASHEMDGKMGDGGGEDFGRVYFVDLNVEFARKCFSEADKRLLTENICNNLHFNGSIFYLIETHNCT